MPRGAGRVCQALDTTDRAKHSPASQDRGWRMRGETWALALSVRRGLIEDDEEGRDAPIPDREVVREDQLRG